MCQILQLRAMPQICRAVRTCVALLDPAGPIILLADAASYLTGTPFCPTSRAAAQVADVRDGSSETGDVSGRKYRDTLRSERQLSIFPAASTALHTGPTSLARTGGHSDGTQACRQAGGRQDAGKAPVSSFKLPKLLYSPQQLHVKRLFMMAGHDGRSGGAGFCAVADLPLAEICLVFVSYSLL